ncbi:FKBP65 [Symbiodinium sp. KB8]|nr:FKBP65 [Symbiodinium sp. KB8]
MAHKETLFAVVRSIKSGPRKASQAASNLLRLGLVETDRDHLALIRALGRQGAWAASLEVFESMQKAQLQPSDLHCTALMRACTKGGDPATAMRVFAEVAEPSAMVFAAAISTCGAAGDWEIALDILSAMEDAELNPDLVSFNAALAACHRAVKSKPALRLLEEIRRRELQPDVVSYSTVISACEEGRRWLQALRLLSSMGQVKVPPNVVTYSAAISACEKGRQWERALQLISEMRGSGVEPNVVSHASVLSACEKAQEWRWALHYWAQLQSAGVRMNRVTYSAAIGAAGIGKHWDASVRLLAEMWARRVMPDVRNYTLALSTLEQARQWQLAVHLLLQMRQRKLKPDLICHSIVKRARFAGRLGRRSSRTSRLRLLRRPGEEAESTPLVLSAGKAVAVGYDEVTLHFATTEVRLFCGVRIYDASVNSDLQRSRVAAMVETMAGEEGQDLPADIKKEVVTKAAYTARAPKTGDEVRIRYVAVVNNWPVDTVDTSDGVRFTLGRGEVMEAWDRAVATMKKGETSKFTVPEMYLSGGPDRFRQKLPDDGQDVLFEIELVAVRSITDLFGEAASQEAETAEVIWNLLEGDDYGPSPKVTDEVQINYVLSLPSGEVLEKRVGIDFRMASASMNEIHCSKAIQKSLLSLKPNTTVKLACRSDYAAGDGGNKELGIPASSDVLVHMDLLQIYEFEDVGKKASWEENLVMKKAIKAVRSRLCPGFDGTWCKVKLLSATVGQEEKLSEEVMVNSVVGNGEMCDALEAACACMRKGEVALVTVKPIPSLYLPGVPNLEVPPESGNVVFKLEMVDFGSFGRQFGESRLEFCQKQKERGSAHFKSGRVRLAYERYSRVVALLPRYKRPLGSTTSVEVFEDPEERQALKLDLAYSAARFCDEVLKEDPKNVKALYRRAQGLLGSNDFEEAQRDCKAVLEIEPANKDARLLMQKVRQAEKEQLKMQKEQFGASLVRKLA